MVGEGPGDPWLTCLGACIYCSVRLRMQFFACRYTLQSFPCNGSDKLVDVTQAY